MNLLHSLPADADQEVCEPLVETDAFRLERIVTRGQTTPADQWYDQPRPEWVMVLSGRARLVFENPDEMIQLGPGDALLIEPHRRHRVDWVDESAPVIWLALHFSRGESRVD
jgi:cupin 2 domain-containing protein